MGSTNSSQIMACDQARVEPSVLARVMGAAVFADLVNPVMAATAALSVTAMV